jgi:hypothetical protein
LQHNRALCGLKSDILTCPGSADFVAEVRCKLLWSVIPSL